VVACVPVLLRGRELRHLHGFLKEGSARMRANNALTPEEVEEGWILTCQGLPSGRTVTVEYEAM